MLDCIETIHQTKQTIKVQSKCPKGDVPWRYIYFRPSLSKIRSETKSRQQFPEIVDQKSFQAEGLTIGRWESSDLMYTRKQLAGHEIHFQLRSWHLVDENHLTWCIWLLVKKWLVFHVCHDLMQYLYVTWFSFPTNKISIDPPGLS